MTEQSQVEEDTPERSYRVPTRLDHYGDAEETVAAQDVEAAGQWDERNWRRL